ncbi:MAG: hypothetical protein QNJ97_17985 [Myxococcota bacterium]|nr:hypothetical protein [Myxococcota bacterium]
MKKILLAALAVLALGACSGGYVRNSESAQVAKDVARQQAQYGTVQPVPAYDWSLERDLLIQLYNIRNMEASTHAVWRSDYGTIEFDCPAIGFGIPYDASLTNPLTQEKRYWGPAVGASVDVVSQPEPNGIFASQNTSATWVLCAGEGGALEPIYIEAKVTVFPFPVKVDYETGRVTRAGKASVTMERHGS